MATLAQVKAGAAAYIEQEIIAKIGGWQKWVAGAAVSMALNRADSIFEALRQNPAVQILGIVDGDGNIDVDALYAEFKRQAQRGAVSFDVPMIGKLTLNESDVDKIYQSIKGVSA
jgi:hypothetical protein